MNKTTPADRLIKSSRPALRLSLALLVALSLPPACDPEDVPTCSTGEPMVAPCVWELYDSCLPKLDSCESESSYVCSSDSSWYHLSFEDGQGAETEIIKDGQLCYRERRHTVVFQGAFRNYFNGAGEHIATSARTASNGPVTTTCHRTGQQYTYREFCSDELPTNRCASITPGTCP